MGSGMSTSERKSDSWDEVDMYRGGMVTVCIEGWLKTQTDKMCFVCFIMSYLFIKADKNITASLKSLGNCVFFQYHSSHNWYSPLRAAPLPSGETSPSAACRAGWTEAERRWVSQTAGDQEGCADFSLSSFPVSTRSTATGFKKQRI